MKLYYLEYQTSEGQHKRWFTSMRKAIRHRTWLRKNRADYGLEQMFGIRKTDITPTLKGILRFLNVHAARD